MSYTADRNEDMRPLVTDAEKMASITDNITPEQRPAFRLRWGRGRPNSIHAGRAALYVQTWGTKDHAPLWTPVASLPASASNRDTPSDTYLRTQLEECASAAILSVLRVEDCHNVKRVP